MAILLRTNGTEATVQPANGTDFGLKEVYALLDIQTVEMVPLADGRIMLLDEEGKLSGAPFNLKATDLYLMGRRGYDAIVGDVLVCQSEEFL